MQNKNVVLALFIKKQAKILQKKNVLSGTMEVIELKMDIQTQHVAEAEETYLVCYILSLSCIPHICIHIFVHTHEIKMYACTSLFLY